MTVVEPMSYDDLLDHCKRLEEEIDRQVPVYVAIQMCETCGYKALAPAVCSDHPGTAHRSIPYIGMRQHQDHMAGKDEHIATLRRDLQDQGLALSNKTFRLREARALLDDCREAMRGLPTLTTEQDDVRIRLATFLG